MKLPIVSAALIALALAACRGPDQSTPAAPQGGDHSATTAIAEPDSPAPSSSDRVTEAGATGQSSAMPVPPNPDPPIPRLYHGRWGLVPADCTSTAGDAKGLMIVNGETVRFYESLATAQEELVGPEGSYTVRFAVTGEGRTWEAIMRFTRSGDILTRSQEGASYSYSRCP